MLKNFFKEMKNFFRVPQRKELSKVQNVMHDWGEQARPREEMFYNQSFQSCEFIHIKNI